MSTKFDLERFKAGEPAVDSFGEERIYLATAPTGEIVTWHSGASAPASWNPKQLSDWTMKPKDEWTFVQDDIIFSSREDTEAYIKKGAYEDSFAVKIIRE